MGVLPSSKADEVDRNMTQGRICFGPLFCVRMYGSTCLALIPYGIDILLHTTSESTTLTLPSIPRTNHGKSMVSHVFTFPFGVDRDWRSSDIDMA